MTDDDAVVVLRRLRGCGVPKPELTIALNPEPRPALVGASHWLTSDKPALVLAGTPGAGKTVAAAWAALIWGLSWPWNGMPTGSSRPPLLWLGPVEIRRLGGFDSNAQMMLDAAELAAFLVVDDAAREGNRPSTEALSDVMQQRVDRGRLTVLTTNSTGEEFRRRYGIPLADRLRAAAVAPDLRGEKSGRAA